MSPLNRFLTGVRVVDLSRHLPGPLAALFLADMGAEVLKIEPLEGDGLRTMGPVGPGGRSVYFDAVNAGKSIRQMNLKQDNIRAEFLDLVRAADVIMESFRPGVMAKLRLSYETLKAVNPRIIYCSLNGFGCSGSPHVRSRGLVRRTSSGALQALFPAVVNGQPPRRCAEVYEQSGHPEGIRT